MAKPKLELQINIPSTIKLLQSEPATGENSYGQWWLYNVECEGLEYSYFAPEKVVQILKANNVGKDEEVVITKKLVKNGKKNVTDYEVHVLENNNTPVHTNNNTNGRTNGSINGNGHLQNGHQINNNGNLQSAENTKSTYSKDYSMMLQCMTEAMMLRDELGHDVDVNKLGITLFLRKVKP